jgi:hypothetical protein
MISGTATGARSVHWCHAARSSFFGRGQEGSQSMPQGYGPHGVISFAEIIITLSVFVIALTAFVYMGYRTRRRVH